MRNDALRAQSQRGLVLVFIRGKDPGDIQGNGIRELLTIGKLVSRPAFDRAKRSKRQAQAHEN